ncbi:MAG: BPSS1780 family membrane protein [Pseudomonadota bacterium]|nr:BPSS1780 family membrane protein [Pseudomonadota bacterium]
MEPISVPASDGWTWIKQGWGMFVKNPGMWIVLILVLIVIWVVASAIPYIGGLALALISPVLVGGLYLAIDTAERGGELELSKLFSCFQDREKLNPLLTLGAVTFGVALVVMLVAAVFIGSSVAALGLASGQPPHMGLGAGLGVTAFLAIGIILTLQIALSMGMMFGIPLVTLRGVEPIAALRSSFSGCLKNIPALLVFTLVGVGLTVVAIIPLGLGLLILLPLISCATYRAFNAIYPASGEMQPADPETA